jgi:hypothetical protein
MAFKAMRLGEITRIESRGKKGLKTEDWGAPV